jgi:hypothetical protein
MCTLFYNDSTKHVKTYKMWLKFFFLICHGGIHLGIQTRYDVSIKSVSDNLTEGTIPLQEDSKTDQTTSENMKPPIAIPSSD